MATPRFGTFVEPEYFDSKAFRSLSGVQVRLLMGFLRRRKRGKNKWRKTNRYPVLNGRELVFVVKDMMVEVGTKRPGTVTEARDKLIEVGFIDIVHGFGGRAVAPTIYGLSDRYWKWDPEPKIRQSNGFEEVIRKPDPRHNKFYRERRKEKSSATETRSSATTGNRSRRHNATTGKRSGKVISEKDEDGKKALSAGPV